MTATNGKGDTPLRSEHDIVRARQLVRRLTQELNFSLVDQTKMVTAASELARNAYTYGRGGTMHWEVVATESRNGLGMGLTGAKRLVNDFAIDSKVGGGTRVTIVRWK